MYDPLFMRSEFGMMSRTSFANCERRDEGSLEVVTMTLGFLIPA